MNKLLNAVDLNDSTWIMVSVAMICFTVLFLPIIKDVLKRKCLKNKKYHNDNKKPKKGEEE